MKIAEQPLTAWGDESIRVLAEKPMYLIAACVIHGSANMAISELEKLKPPHAKKIHWRDMGLRTQKESLSIISNIKHSTTVVVATPLKSNRQERARRKCLEVLLPHLETQNVSMLVLESRGSFSDKKDIDYLFYLRRSRVVTAIDITHAEGHAEPYLCIPDQILGAYGEMAISGNNLPSWANQWEKIQEAVTTLNVPL